MMASLAINWLFAAALVAGTVYVLGRELIAYYFHTKEQYVDRLVEKQKGLKNGQS